MINILLSYNHDQHIVSIKSRSTYCYHYFCARLAVMTGHRKTLSAATHLDNQCITIITTTSSITTIIISISITSKTTISTINIIIIAIISTITIIIFSQDPRFNPSLDHPVGYRWAPLWWLFANFQLVLIQMQMQDIPIQKQTQMIQIQMHNR